MGWIRKLLGGGGGGDGDGGATPPRKGAPEHAVLLHLRLADDEFGAEGEVEEMHALQDELEGALGEAGELDGDEFGGGFCVIYLYGPDAEKLWEALAPVLEKRPFRKGSYAVKRFGPPGEGREEKVDLFFEG